MFYMERKILFVLIFFFAAAISGLFAENKLCVSADFVRLRSSPNTNGKIIRNLFLLDKFFSAERTGSPVKIGNYNDYWYKTIFKICQPPECTNTEITGYVYGPFLDSCESVINKYRSVLKSNAPLQEKLLYRKIYAQERMLPGGKSTEKNNVMGGCCNHTTYVTSKFTWSIQNGGILFDITYRSKLIVELNGKDEITYDNNVLQCTVTGLQYKNETEFDLIAEGEKPYCKERVINLRLTPLELGGAMDDEASGMFR